MRTVGGSMKEVSEARNPSSLFFLLPFLLALLSSSMSAFLISILLPLSLSPFVILNPLLRTAVWKKKHTIKSQSRSHICYTGTWVKVRLHGAIFSSTCPATIAATCLTKYFKLNCRLHAAMIYTRNLSRTSCRENCSVSTISVRHVRTVIFHQHIKFSLLLRGSY